MRAVLTLNEEYETRFLCCSARYLKARPACELSVGRKSHSSSFVLSCRSSSQRSLAQPPAT